MKNLFSLTLFLLLFSTAYAQNYSYSFDGELDQSAITKIENKCSEFESVTSTKIKYKEDAQKGEIIIFLVKKEGQRAEEDNQFKATDIKKILINSGLTPGEFRTLKK